MSLLLRTLSSHYRNHPIQAGFLLAGIVIANVLLVGTQLINAQARSSQAEGERLLRAAAVGRVVSRTGSGFIDERHYFRLRREGFDMLAPVLVESVRTRSGEVLQLLGIDLLAVPRPPGPQAELRDSPAVSPGEGLAAFTLEPHELWLAPARLRQLGWKEGMRPILANGKELPPARLMSGAGLGHRPLLDIGALQSLTGSFGKLSHLLVFDAEPYRLNRLRAALPEGLTFVAGEEQPDPGAMTRSFHLNLAAMGLLTFLVGIFLTYNALAFSYTDRRELMRRMRLAGVSRFGMAGALVCELGVFLLVGSLIGAWLGGHVAGWLLPGVGRTLAQLYDVHIHYPDRFLGHWAWWPLLMTAVAAVACMCLPLRETLIAPVLGRASTPWRQRRIRRRDRILLILGLASLVVAWTTAREATRLWPALAGMAFLLLGAALCLPAILGISLSFLERVVPRSCARVRWLIADSRWLLGPAATALMALVLALVANHGLNTMVASFRQATDDWLQQRLAGQLYLRGEHDAAALRRWLAEHEPAVGAEERFRVDVRRTAPSGQRVKVEIVTLHDDPRFLKSLELMTPQTDAKTRFADGNGLFVSERAWRIEGWGPGDRVVLCPAQGSVEVLGAYHDYGNPHAQWMTHRALFQTCWPRAAATGVALVGPDWVDWPDLRARIARAFGIPLTEIADRGEIRRAGLAVFERTFTVTDALNALTLLVAGIGVFCAVSAIQHHRVGEQALLASLGVRRRERALLLVSQWGLLGLLCMVVVLPLGTALAAYLAGVVTPVAFGWSFPLVERWPAVISLVILAIVSLSLAVGLPSLGLLRTSPAALLRERDT